MSLLLPPDISQILPIDISNIFILLAGKKGTALGHGKREPLSSYSLDRCSLSTNNWPDAELGAGYRDISKTNTAPELRDFTVS